MQADLLELKNGTILNGTYTGGTAERCVSIMRVFAGLIAATFHIIIDLEFPRRGMIRIDSFDQVLVDLRQSMK